MKVIANLRRSDFVWMNIYLLPRLAPNWIAVTVVALGQFVWGLFGTPGDVDADKLIYWGTKGVTTGFFAVLLGLTFCIVLMLIFTSEKSGHLGVHEFDIRPDGLFEKTAVNEQLSKWPGVTAIMKNGSSIYVRLGGYLFHIIPRRSFASDSEFEAFYEELRSHRDLPLAKAQ